MEPLKLGLFSTIQEATRGYHPDLDIQKIACHLRESALPRLYMVLHTATPSGLGDQPGKHQYVVSVPTLPTCISESRFQLRKQNSSSVAAR
jgi:hypothetical protein